jgi:hypothetical protein
VFQYMSIWAARPGPALARARHGPVKFLPGLARHYCPPCRVVLAHGLRRRPKPRPMGMFCAGPARKARAQVAGRASPQPTKSSTTVSTPNFTTILISQTFNGHSKITKSRTHISQVTTHNQTSQITTDTRGKISKRPPLKRNYRSILTLDLCDQVLAASLKTFLGKTHPCEKP